MYECCPQYLRISTARMKSDKKNEKEDNHKRKNMERSKVNKKKQRNTEGLTIARAINI